MQTGTQLHAPEGFDVLRKNTIYYFLRSDSTRKRALLIEFRHVPRTSKRSISSTEKSATPIVATPDGSPEAPLTTISKLGAFKPVLTFLKRHRFEEALDAKKILPCELQEELPPWFLGMSIEELQHYSDPRIGRKISHGERIDKLLAHLWPLIQNLDQVLAAELPDALINAHARACNPPQNETRMRTAFYAYICFGFCRWVLHYKVFNIGRWDRMGRNRKFGRPSRLNGADHGYGTNDPEMICKISEGYRKFAGPGQHLSKIYRRTIRSIFGCVVQTDPMGVKYFVHPAGEPFPSLGQFVYRVAQEFPLEIRQIYKYGNTRVRTRLKHSQGRFAESVGNLMERTEQDAYCCDKVSVGYKAGSHLPALWVVRTRCIASGMIVGIGFSVGGEAASAYRMALFCEAIGKVKFCRLFGLEIKLVDWPSIGISPHIINDRGPGSTAKADAADASFRPVIKEAAPSYSGQSKASIETTHPKQVKIEGKPHYMETRLSIPQLAIQEILRVISDNHSLDVSDRLNNDAIAKQIFPTPVSIWHYLDNKGRNHALTMQFAEAVRAYLTPIELMVLDDAIYFKDQRFNSGALKKSGALQKAHTSGTYKIKGYMLDVCVRHLWVEIDMQLIEVDAMLAIRDGQEPLYISDVELEQIAQIRRDAKLELKLHRLAVQAETDERFEQHTGQPFDQAIIKGGRNRRSKAVSVRERQDIMPYMRAKGGHR